MENTNSLPYAKNLPISRLASIFNRRTNSYKYLFFTALLNLMENSCFKESVFYVNDIYTEMLTIAWYPHTFYRLNFGSQDQIGSLLDRIGNTFSVPGILSKQYREKLKISLTQYTTEISKVLDKYVKFRLLRPFFSEDVKNLEDTLLHKKIKFLAYNKTEEFWPLYYISEDESEIIIPPPWINYIAANIKILKNFAAWEWLVYMQKRNPSVPNLHKKLFPPVSRESLSLQTHYWKHVLEITPLTCIFSGELLQSKDISLDHFLPWSFVAHDQLWNLLPVSKSINSSKSNNLPSLDRYFIEFADLQYHALVTYHQHPGKQNWGKIIEPYLTDLSLNENDILDKVKLKESLETVIFPLYELAKNQGFSPNWVYNSFQSKNVLN